MSEVIRGWHFVGNDRRLRHDAQDVIVAPGYTYSWVGDGKPKVCSRATHEQLTDAWDAASDVAQEAAQQAATAVALDADMAAWNASRAAQAAELERRMLALVGEDEG